jgi:hypothetical protein
MMRLFTTLIILSLGLLGCLELSPQAGRVVNQVLLTLPNRSPVVNSNSLTRTVIKDRGNQVLSTLTAGSDPENGSVFYKVFQFPSKGFLTNCLGLNDSANLDLDCFYQPFGGVPFGGVTGTDTFIYEVTDEELNATQVTVTITIKENSKPVAVSATVSIMGEQALGTFTPASDPDGDSLVYRLVTFPQKGDLSDCLGLDSSDNDDLACNYDPDDNFQGSDSFIYGASDPLGAVGTASVTITISSTNVLPVASTNPYTAYVIKNKGWQDINLTNTSSFSLTDPDGTPPDYLSYKVITPASSGSFALCMDQEGSSGPYPDLTCAYKPHTDIQGTDRVTFRVTDQDSGYVDVLLYISIQNSTPSFTSTRFSVQEELSTSFTIGINDGGDGDLTYAFGTSPLRQGRFTGRLNKGTLSNCLGLNGSTDFDVSCSYTSDLDVTSSAADTFKVKIRDLGGIEVEETITIDVSNMNDAPQMLDQRFDFLENGVKQSFTIAPGWDVDPDETTQLTYTTSTSVLANGFLDKCLGLSGSASSPDLTCRFTPDTAFDGTNTFVVTVTDPNGSTGSATMTLDVKTSLLP